LEAKLKHLEFIQTVITRLATNSFLFKGWAITIAASRHASPWAARIYNDAIARGKDHPHAVRILARAWLYVIWECWHHGVAYDPARNRGLQRLLAAQDNIADQAA
jgi:transposase